MKHFVLIIVCFVMFTSLVYSQTTCEDCGTVNTTLTATPASTPAGIVFLYDWSTSATTSSINVTSAGTYTVTVTQSDSGGSCPDIVTTNTYTVIANPLPVCSPSSNAVCVGGTLNLSSNVTSGTAPFTYAWTGPSGYTSTAANPTRTNATTAMSGTYNLVVTDSKGCQSVSCSVTVTVGTMPAVSINFSCS